jgi:hypothetical protein
MVYEGQGETKKAKSMVGEVLEIDGKLGIPDHDDREHFERLNGTTEPVQDVLASAIASW